MLAAWVVAGEAARGGLRRTSQQQKTDQQNKKATDDAYKAGLKMIPDAKEKYDPWKNAR
jgi:hypothetical protein